MKHFFVNCRRRQYLNRIISVKEWHEKVIGRIIDEGGGYHREDDKTSTLGMHSKLKHKCSLFSVVKATLESQMSVSPSDSLSIINSSDCLLPISIVHVDHYAYRQ